MADHSEKHFYPGRDENILADEGHPGYPMDEIEQPYRHDRNASESSISLDNDTENYTLEGDKSNDSSSTENERGFQPVIAGDREELQRIASTYNGSNALGRSNTGASSRLSRQDTLAGVQLGDPVLDPSSPDFNVYKWARM
jgi:ATP-binding cassette subfamily G (WHITE) protein 2 (PDR)